ncbi:hypothetical protein [Leptotrichia sp. oral taxon 223]|uniref:hypothetical protein n=1 Tax=Leptotrichia sp. oral taxon 223 TaxID=712363 RepID=UPI0015C17BEB|nr:hypothetical protein [Leptotrichia sp. oral taxon 223]NWO18316.1 hypothetical protein [Leptotrichia sp. oral taxon 223]
MKKIILLGILILTFVAQANSSFNIIDDDYNMKGYCLGIGKAKVDKVDKYTGTTTFRAALCRVDDKVVRNVTVLFDYIDVNTNYDIRKKLFFIPVVNLAQAKYNSDNNILRMHMQMRGTAYKNLPDGFILPITSKNIKDHLPYAKIVDEDLVEVYGSTLGVPTVSEEEFLDEDY